MKSIYLNLSLMAIMIMTAGCEKLLDFDEPGDIVPKTVAEDPLLPSIKANGTIFHAESFGDIHNPILIFLHGGPGCDYRAFISQIGMENQSRYPDKRTYPDGGLSQLQDNYYCVFYDQRGAGLSPRFDKGVINFDMYVEDLKAIIEYFIQKKETETGISEEQVNIFGWSYGGILATGFINTYPEKIRDIVFYEPGPFSKEAVNYFKERMTSVFGQIGDEWLEDYLLSHDHISSDSHERGDYQRLLGAFRMQPEFHENPSCPLWRFGSFVSHENLDFFNSDEYDITSNLTSFKGRALFIAGSLTMGEFPDYMNLQQKFYPANKLVIIPNVGHTGPWEKPNEVSGIIRHFLQ